MMEMEDEEKGEEEEEGDEKEAEEDETVWLGDSFLQSVLIGGRPPFSRAALRNRFISSFVDLHNYQHSGHCCPCRRRRRRSR